MRAAKEKKLNRLPESIFKRMDSEFSCQPAATQKQNQPTTKSNRPTVVNRISNYDFRTRKFQKPPIGTSEKFRPIVPRQDQHWARKYTGENVLQLRRTRWAPEMSLYRAYFVPGMVDPDGMKKVCCSFSNGSKIWSDTYEADDDETPLERCKRRATWGWGKDWKVIGARCGVCNEKPPTGPCGGGLDEATEKVYHLCMLICDNIPIDNPVRAKNACKKLGPPESVARKLCEWAAGQIPDVPDVKGAACDKICCSGKLPEGIPGQECLSVFFDGKIKNRRKQVDACHACCREKGNPRYCTQMCTNQGGGF